MRGERPGSWQAKQLQRLVADTAGKAWPEHRCAMLSNPAAECAIDGIVLEELWPGVVQALQGSGLTALTGDDGATPAQALVTLHREFTTRTLTFVIEDPDRPAALRVWKPWYCRFAIEASVERYFLDKTTLLSFPEDFDMSRLTRVLQEPLMQGCPPELSWHEGFDGPGMYSLKIHTGEGASWGLRGEAEARSFIRKAVEDHVKVIAAMDRLAEDWSDASAFNEVHRLATAANTVF